MPEWVLLAFFLVGSTPVGYFVIRISYPEVRVYESSLKVGYSMLAGAFLVVLAYAFDAQIATPASRVEGGLLPLTFVLACVASFVVLRLLVMLMLPREIQLGLPIRHHSLNAASSRVSEPEAGPVGAIGREFLGIIERQSRAQMTDRINNDG